MKIKCSNHSFQSCGNCTGLKRAISLTSLCYIYASVSKRTENLLTIYLSQNRGANALSRKIVVKRHLKGSPGVTSTRLGVKVATFAPISDRTSSRESTDRNTEYFGQARHKKMILRVFTVQCLLVHIYH